MIAIIEKFKTIYVRGFNKDDNLPTLIAVLLKSSLASLNLSSSFLWLEKA